MTGMPYLCATRPAEWWDTADDGARLALALCRVCPARALCAATARGEAGVIRAGMAYLDRGGIAPICRCGYPIIHRPDTGQRAVLCRRCDPPPPRRWSRRNYWAAYYRRCKTRSAA